MWGETELVRSKILASSICFEPISAFFQVLPQKKIVRGNLEDLCGYRIPTNKVIMASYEQLMKTMTHQ